MKKLFFLIISLLCLGIIKSSAQYTDLHDFSTVAPNGESPYGSLTLSGNVLYGMTEIGGAFGNGTIFSINTAGSGYTDLHDFNYVANGMMPTGTLTLSGNVLYGMANGGANGDGLIFSINTDGSGYTDLYDFNEGNGTSLGNSLTLSGGVLYGMTQYGGMNSKGVVFSININGSGYTDLLDFTGSNGEYPWGSLTLSGSKLYGIVPGGANGYGVIFSINTNGSGYTDLFDFNGTNGSSPYGSLTLSGNELFGMTSGEGTSDAGNIFSINTNGSGYKELLNFDTVITDNGAADPWGNLTQSGNILYGMTTSGGINGDGCIFSIKMDGTGYNDLLDFNDSNGSGSSPGSTLALSGNVLYGMTEEGGAYGNGVIFSFKPASLAVNNLIPNPESIKVYPNPSDGLFNFQILNAELSILNAKIEVYNMLGEKVYTQLLFLNYPFLLNLSSQPNGIYLYRLIANGGNLIKEGKLEIQR